MAAESLEQDQLQVSSSSFQKLTSHIPELS